MDEAAPPRKPRRLRGCLVRIVLVFCVAPPLLAWWANGPGFRWAIRHALENILPDRAPGLVITARPGGTLWRGPDLREIDLDWPERGIRARADRLDVRWDPAAAWRERNLMAGLQSVTLDGAHAVVTPSAFGREDKQTETDEKPEPAAWRMPDLHPILTRVQDIWWRIDPLKIEVKDSKLVLRGVDGGDLLALEGGIMKPAGETLAANWTGTVSPAIRDGGAPVAVSGSAAWDGTSLHVTDAALFPDLTIETLDAVIADAALSLNTRVKSCGGTFTLSTDLSSKAALDLAEGALDVGLLLESLRPWLPADRPMPAITGTLRELSFALERPGMDAAQWELKTAVENASWKDKALPDTHVNIICARPGEAMAEWRAALGGNTAHGSLTFTGLADLPWKKSPKSVAGPLEVDVRDLDAARPWLPRALDRLTASGTVRGRLRWSPPHWSTLVGTAVIEGEAGSFGRWPWPAFRTEAERDDAGRCSGVFETVHPETRAADGFVHVAADLAPKSPVMDFQVRIENPPRALIDQYLPDARLDDLKLEGPLRLRGATSLQWRTGRITSILVEELTANAKWRDLPGIAIESSVQWSPDELLAGVVARATHGPRATAALERAKAGRSTLTVEAFDVADALLRIAADLPVDETMLGSLAALPRSQEPWQITATLASHPFTRWEKLLAPFGISLPELAYATAEPGMDLWIGGSPARPDVSGNLFLNLAEPARDSGLHPAKAVVTLKTEVTGEEPPMLQAVGTLQVESGPTTRLDAELPLNPPRWLDDPDALGESPLRASVELPPTPLSLIGALIPNITLPPGTADAKLRARGTLAAPEFSGRARVEVPRLPRPDQPAAPPLEDIVLAIEADGTDLRVTEGRATLGGGRIDLSGTVDLAKPREPRFDLALDGRALLVHRSDQISLRTDARLALTGALRACTLSGDLDVVQSLYIRDFEILPLGLAGTRLRAPSLPTFEAARKPELPEDSLLRTLALDLRVTTRDPVLLRSNIAQGDLAGTVTIGGTAANPAPTGVISIVNGSARLPFSRMEMTEGELVFRPDAPTDPNIRIQGVSSVGGHRVRLFFYGPVSSPSLVLTATPPLPEEEILNLLATGATSSDLEGGQLAALKAAALLIDDYVPVLGIGADTNRGGPLSWARRAVSQLDLRLGETDRLSGHQRSGARLRLGERWQLDATVDDTGNERATMMYFFRIR